MLQSHGTHIPLRPATGAVAPAGLARAAVGRSARRPADAINSAPVKPPNQARRVPVPLRVATRIPGPTAVTARRVRVPPAAPPAPGAAEVGADNGAGDDTQFTNGPTTDPPPVPEDVLREFEQKLEADLASVGLTLMAVTGVIVFWRGVWSLLDYFMGDTLLGSLSCIVFGLSLVLWLRLSGARVATSFWPPG